MVSSDSNSITQSDLEHRSYQIQVVLNSYSDYDPTKVEELLCEKKWERFYSITNEIDEEHLILEKKISSETILDGSFTETYQFRRNGDFLREYDSGFSQWGIDEGTWRFDSATKTLTLLGESVSLTAFCPNVMVWENCYVQICPLSGRKKMYCRHTVYIVK